MKLHKTIAALAGVLLLLTACWPVCLAEGTDPSQWTVTYSVDGYLFKEQVPAGGKPAQVPVLPEGYSAWQDRSGAVVEPSQTEIQENTVFTAVSSGVLPLSPPGKPEENASPAHPIASASGTHAPFMSAAPDGLFHPYDSITRADAAKIIYGLMQAPPQAAGSYPDLPAGAWYTQPMAVLGDLGLLRPADSGAMRPVEPVTRAEFARMISYFLPGISGGPSFSDVPPLHWAHDAIAASTAAGIFGGYSDKTFRPDGKLSRAETAVAVGRLLGRTGDRTALAASAASVCILPDVPADCWAYDAIMEAVVPHTASYASGRETWTQTGPYRTALPDGYHTIGNRLYRVSGGMFLRNTTADGFTYDANGRYTTGSAALDAQLDAVIAAHTNASMTRDEKLRALYVYLRDNYKYLKKPLVAKGSVGWEPGYAAEFLDTKRGNCFSYSAAYCLLARQMGLPAVTVVGKLGTRNVQDHGWVEMVLDGKNYMFDVELEWSYLYKYGQRRDLFKMDPAKAPFVYTR